MRDGRSKTARQQDREIGTPVRELQRQADREIERHGGAIIRRYESREAAGQGDKRTSRLGGGDKE